MILCVIIKKGTGANMEVIERKLKTGAWLDFKNNTWLIGTERAPSEWRDDLKPYLGTDGSVLVIQVQQRWAGLKGMVADWLHRNADKF